MTDLSSGLTAFSAILRALIQVGKTGHGVDIAISMFDVMADWMNMALLSHRYMGGAPNRTGLQHSFIAPYGAFTCGDGTQILLSIQSNREWAAFCEHVLQDLKLIDDYRFVNNTDRFKNRVELDSRVNSCFLKYNKAEIISLLKIARIAYSSLNSVSDLSTHPFLKTSYAEIGGEQVELASLPVVTASGSLEKVPDLGEHSDLIRNEFTSLFGVK
jgi:formyl-CoA transferase